MDNWKSPEEIPKIDGDQDNFIVAVRRHTIGSGKVLVFPAVYLDGMLLHYEEGCPNCPEKEEDCADYNGDGCPTSGWFECEPSSDYDSGLYVPLLRKSNVSADVLEGWQPMPDWSLESEESSDTGAVKHE